MAGYGGAIKLTGATEYKRALDQITQSLKENASEMKLVASQYDKGDKSTEALRARSDALNKLLDQQKNKLSTLKSEYADLSTRVQEQANKHKDLVDQYNSEKQKLDTLENTLGKTSQEYKDQAKVVNDLANQVSTSTKNNDANEKSLSQLRVQMNNTQSEINQTEKDIKELGEATKKSGKEAEDASKGGYTVMKNVLANLATQAIQGVISGLKQMGTAFINVGKEAVNSFAEYEQLAGGAQKIFDQIDYAEIEKDAQDAYLNMGMSANQYLQMVTSVGANFASTLGDRKGYDVAKQGMQSITDFATGTGKSVDELAQKYQAITKSTSSYQSIADQFAGVLPATSAGFLEIAQKAGILSDKYKKLTEVPMAEYQEAVTKMITRGVEELGLSGNTVAEATGTISGSLAMMKASWANLLTGIADDNADFGMLVENFINSLITPDGTGGVIGQLKDKIVTVIGGISQVLQTLLPQLIQAVVPIIQQNLPVILTAVNNALVAILQLLPTIMPTIQQLIPQIVTTLVNNLPMIIETGIQLIIALINGINDSMPQLINLLPVIVTEIAQTIIKNLPKILKTGIELIANLIAGLYQAMSGLVAPAVEIIATLLKAIKSKFSDMVSAGRDLVAGIWDGINGAYWWLRDKIAGWVGNVTSFIKRLFGIASPSKLFRDEIGENLALGIGEGFSDEMDDVSQMMADSIPTSFDINPKLNGSSGVTQGYDMVTAFKEALSEMKIILDDDEVGRFVENTVARAVYV